MKVMWVSEDDSDIYNIVAVFFFPLHSLSHPGIPQIYTLSWIH